MAINAPAEQLNNEAPANTNRFGASTTQAIQTILGAVRPEYLTPENFNLEDYLRFSEFPPDDEFGRFAAPRVNQAIDDEVEALVIVFDQDPNEVSPQRQRQLEAEAEARYKRNKKWISSLQKIIPSKVDSPKVGVINKIGKAIVTAGTVAAFGYVADIAERGMPSSGFLVHSVAACLYGMTAIKFKGNPYDINLAKGKTETNSRAVLGEVSKKFQQEANTNNHPRNVWEKLKYAMSGGPQAINIIYNRVFPEHREIGYRIEDVINSMGVKFNEAGQLINRPRNADATSVLDIVDGFFKEDGEDSRSVKESAFKVLLTHALYRYPELQLGQEKHTDSVARMSQTLDYLLVRLATDIGTYNSDFLESTSKAALVGFEQDMDKLNGIFRRRDVAKAGIIATARYAISSGVAAFADSLVTPLQIRQFSEQVAGFVDRFASSGEISTATGNALRSIRDISPISVRKLAREMINGSDFTLIPNDPQGTLDSALQFSGLERVAFAAADVTHWQSNLYRGLESILTQPDLQIPFIQKLPSLLSSLGNGISQDDLLCAIVDSNIPIQSIVNDDPSVHIGTLKASLANISRLPKTDEVAAVKNLCKTLTTQIGAPFASPALIEEANAVLGFADQLEGVQNSFTNRVKGFEVPALSRFWSSLVLSTVMGVKKNLRPKLEPIFSNVTPFGDIVAPVANPLVGPRRQPQLQPQQVPVARVVQPQEQAPQRPPVVQPAQAPVPVQPPIDPAVYAPAQLPGVPAITPVRSVEETLADLLDADRVISKEPYNDGNGHDDNPPVSA